MKKILVPVDGSDESKKAFEQAVSLAKKFGAEVTLMSVVEVENEVTFSEPGIILPAEYTGVRDTLIKIKEKNMNQTLDAMVERADCAGITVEKAVKIGNAHPEIVDMAGEGKYDIIVMGHRGLNPVKRFFMGSVAKRVIEDAPCSVLIAK